MVCPKCGNNNITSQVVSETTTTSKTKGFGWIKACIGWCLTGPFGILCGLCGMGKSRTRTSTSSKVVHICQDCGYRF